MAHTKIPPHYWLGTSMSLLGIITMCQGFVKTPAALYACRTLMGIFEGSLTPAAALMMVSRDCTKTHRKDTKRSRDHTIEGMSFLFVMQVSPPVH